MGKMYVIRLIGYFGKKRNPVEEHKSENQSEKSSYKKQFRVERGRSMKKTRRGRKPGQRVVIMGLYLESQYQKPWMA